MEQKKVIRKKGNTLFIATYQGVVDMKQFGRFANIYFLECDENGNIKDYNGNGVIQKMDIYCKLEDSQEVIDLSTLSDDCLI